MQVQCIDMNYTVEDLFNKGNADKTVNENYRYKLFTLP